jgi:hypothetical protein
MDPDFFAQINATMQLDAGTEDTTQDEKRQILETAQLLSARDAWVYRPSSSGSGPTS